jgi:hypothetical protein
MVADHYNSAIIGDTDNHGILSVKDNTEISCSEQFLLRE